MKKLFLRLLRTNRERNSRITNPSTNLKKTKEPSSIIPCIQKPWLKSVVWPQYEFMGHMPMNEVTVGTVQSCQNWMAHGKEHGRKCDLNAATITRVCGFAGRIFKVAEELGIISYSPFRSTLLKNPGKSAGHHKALPDAEITRIIRAIPSLKVRDERLYMAMLACTGMRKEELLGLRWEDVDLEQCTGLVVRAVTYPDRSKPHNDKTKSESSTRLICLTEPLLSILKEEEQSGGYILGGEQPLCYSTSQRVQQRAFAALDIKGYCNHDFRTTLGTRLKERGLSSANVADVLGHADTRMVEKVYAPRRCEGVRKHLEAIQELNALTG